MNRISLFLGLLLSIVIVFLGFPVVASAEEVTCNLTLLVDGNGLTFPEPGVHSYAAGARVEISAIAGDGWQFDHWTGEVASPRPDTSVIMTADKVVTAYFVLIPPSGTLEGQVKDGQNNNPIQGARVVVYDQYESIKGSVLTDASGAYSQEIPAGNYKVRFMKNGTYEERWYDDAVDFASAQFIQITEAATTVVDGSLHPLNTLTGSVRDFNTDTRIDEGISVRAYNTANVNIGSGDVNDGSFEIRLPPGSYRLKMFDISGYYLSEWYQDAASFETANVLDFASYGETKPPIEIQLNPAGSGAFISGTVTDAATGNGIEGITVSIFNSSEVLVDSVVSGSSGSYTSDPLGTGPYTVEFSIGSGEYVTEWYDNAPGPDSATPVSVNTGETTTVNAVLDRYGPTGISGTVIDARTNFPIQGIHVELMYDNSYWAGDAYTDASGHYVIANLTPGPYYRVKFSENISDNYQEEWNLDSPDWENAIDVAVVEKSLTTVNAKLNPWGKIKGHVTDERTGAGISGIEVTVLNNESLVFTATTDAAGYWEARRLDLDNSNVFKLHFHDGSGSHADEWYHNSSVVNNADIVFLPNLTPVLTVDEQLSLPGTIQGVLEADQENRGTFLEGVPVYAFDLDHNFINQATTDSNGLYRISGLLSGSYKIEFGSINGFDGEWYNDAADFVHADVVTLSSGGTFTADAALTPWGGITGAIVDAVTHNPIKGTWVEVYEGNNLVSKNGGNDSGFYGLTVLPGTYDVYFYDEAHDYAGLWKYGVAITTEFQTLDVKLQPCGTISGTVTSFNGEVLAGAQVTAYNAAHAEQGTDSTDGYGKYEINGLTSGDYRVYIFYEDHTNSIDYIPEWYADADRFETATPLKVAGGDSLTIDATLDAYGQLNGTLLDGVTGEAVTSGTITLTLYDSSHDMVAYGEFDNENPSMFAIQHLKPGDYKAFFHDSSLHYQDEWWENAANWDSAANIDITDGNAVDITVMLNTHGKITKTLSGSYPNPSNLGEPVTLMAVVLNASIRDDVKVTFENGQVNLGTVFQTRTNAGGIPKGTVAFKEGGVTIGTGTLNKLGIATVTTSSLSVGVHNIIAEYSGDTSFSSSIAPPVIQAVKYDSSTNLISSSKASVFGQGVQFTATISSTGGTPTGSITFKDGNQTLKIVPLSNSTAIFNTSTLSIGSHNISAVYSGDVNRAGSSATLVQTVKKAATSTSISSSSSTSNRGQTVKFTATVSAVTPGSGTPAGKVVFKEGSNVLGSATLNASGQATYSTSFSSRGTHKITAVYSGDKNYSVSTSLEINQIVK